MTLTERYQRWYAIVEQLRSLQAEELEHRIALGAGFFPDAPVEGSTTLPLTDGYTLRYTTKLSRTLANKNGETDSVFSQLPPDVAASVFKYSPRLRKRGYDALAAEHRALVDAVLTTKPAAPSLVVVAPAKE